MLQPEAPRTVLPLLCLVIDTTFPDITGYTITSILGVGGFSTVYLARQITLQREVALKVMNPMLVGDGDLCKRFLREAQDTASVSDHPHIVTVFDVGEVNLHYYIAMQYLRGDNLRHRIDTADSLPVPEKTLYQLSSALSYIHQRGFIHRDVKPGNVLFDEAGDAHLSDFGIARMTGRSTQLTQIGTIVGTAKYMSPEQSRGDQTIDARSDLYSLGVVAFEMLALHAPFESNDPMALMLKHLQDPIPTLPAKHVRLQPIVNRLLAKQPDKRYASAEQLMAELQKLAPQHIPCAGPPGKADNRVNNTQATRSKTETPAIAVLGVTFTLLAVLVSSLMFLQTQIDPELPDEELRCPQISQQQIKERDTLIELANVHEAIGRLTRPPGANALEAYTLALEIDPCNSQILSAVGRIRSKSPNP